MAHILVTGDSVFLRRRTCAVLQQTGHNIIEAANGNQCLEIIADNAPDILFLDLMMPELDGFGVLRSLHDTDHRIPVIVLTVDLQESVKKECMHLGAAAFINKPPKEDELLAALTTALDSLETGVCN